MKMTLAMLLAIGACVAADDPEVGTRRQDERIDVHGCRPELVRESAGLQAKSYRAPLSPG